MTANSDCRMASAPALPKIFWHIGRCALQFCQPALAGFVTLDTDLESVDKLTKDFGTTKLRITNYALRLGTSARANSLWEQAVQSLAERLRFNAQI